MRIIFILKIFFQFIRTRIPSVKLKYFLFYKTAKRLWAQPRLKRNSSSGLLEISPPLSFHSNQKCTALQLESRKQLLKTSKNVSQSSTCTRNAARKIAKRNRMTCIKWGDLLPTVTYDRRA